VLAALGSRIATTAFRRLADVARRLVGTALRDVNSGRRFRRLLLLCVSGFDAPLLFFGGRLEYLFDPGVERALAMSGSVRQALAMVPRGRRLKVETVIETVLTWSFVKSASRRQTDWTSIEVVDEWLRE